MEQWIITLLLCEVFASSSKSTYCKFDFSFMTPCGTYLYYWVLLFSVASRCFLWKSKLPAKEEIVNRTVVGVTAWERQQNSKICTMIIGESKRGPTGVTWFVRLATTLSMSGSGYEYLIVFIHQETAKEDIFIIINYLVFVTKILIFVYLLQICKPHGPACPCMEIKQIKQCCTVSNTRNHDWCQCWRYCIVAPSLVSQCKELSGIA